MKLKKERKFDRTEERKRGGVCVCVTEKSHQSNVDCKRTTRYNQGRETIDDDEAYRMHGRKTQLYTPSSFRCRYPWREKHA